jgi:hypothetical protein
MYAETNQRKAVAYKDRPQEKLSGMWIVVEVMTWLMWFAFQRTVE